MELSITQFRRALFDVMSQALAGEHIVVTYKGERLQIVPETGSDRLSRLTPLDLISDEEPEAEQKLKSDMQDAWERDWAGL